MLFRSACSETKSDRCNRLISINNRTSQSVQKLPAENLQPADRFTKAADLLEQAAQEMQNLKPTDSKLLDLQQQLSGFGKSIGGLQVFRREFLHRLARAIVNGNQAIAPIGFGFAASRQH